MASPSASDRPRSPTGFTFLDEGRAHSGEAFVEGSALWLTSLTLKTAFGWELKPQGVCRDDVCIPASAARGADERLIADGRVNLNALAGILGRPLVVEAGEGDASRMAGSRAVAAGAVVYLGASAQQRAETLRSLEAPDFALPDLKGTVHSLKAQRGKKVLLVAYASW